MEEFEADEKAEFIRSLKHKRVDDLISEFSIEAAKTYIAEMKYAKGGKERLKAAEKILDHAIGKPVDRVLNINMEVGAKSNEELDAEIKRLISELGYAGEQGKITTLSPSH